MADGIAALLNALPTTMGEPLRVALVSDSPLVLAGLRAGLSQRNDIAIVLACASLAAGRDAGYGAAQVVIVDVPAAAELPDEGPPLLLLVPPAAAAPGEWLSQGCSVISRDASIELIAAAAHAAGAGLVAASRAAMAAAFRLVPPATSFDELEPLTPREREVLQKMSQGLGNREIADELNISSHTAKFHVAQVIAKLAASSRTHAVAKGLRAGLVEL